jgi:hypothetical protein
MVAQFKDLAFSSVVEILTFLRAIDMVRELYVFILINLWTIFYTHLIEICLCMQMDTYEHI